MEEAGTSTKKDAVCALSRHHHVSESAVQEGKFSTELKPTRAEISAENVSGFLYINNRVHSHFGGVDYSHDSSLFVYLFIRLRYQSATRHLTRSVGR